MSFIEAVTSSTFLGFNHWGYVVIFLAALLEATPMFGLFVPGMVLVLAGGFMVKLGVLDIGDTIIIAAAGAILGDMVGYVLGRRYGISFLEKYGKYFFFKREYFDRTKRVMNNHTGKALVVGRFNSLTRAFAPFVAGTTDVPFPRFLFFNILGGVTWAGTFVVLGFVFGQSYEVVAKTAGRYIALAVVVSVGIVSLYRFVDKRKHIFKKYHLCILALNLFSLYLFAKMVEDVVDAELITRLDVWVSGNMPLLWSPVMNKVMVFITNIASPASLFTFSVILLVAFVLRRKWYHLLLLAFAMGGGVLLELFIKFLVARLRPENALIEVAGYSFPSGHATMATIFFLLLIYAFKDDIKRRWIRFLFTGTMIMSFLLVGISRVYLNVHWASDVIAGFSLGVFWLTLLVLIFEFVAPYFRETLYIRKKT